MLVTKKIIPQNTYRVQTNKGRMSKRFDEDYLTKVAETSNKMLAAGLKIPAPFDHHKEARPRTQQQEDEFISVNKPGSAYHNAGYWKKFWVAPDDKGKPTLYGQLDAAGDISDANSPAYKVTKTNDEVSVSITDNFEDGLGRTWTDGLLHVAIVHHAVVPDQSPFEDNTTVVNMSMVDDTDDVSPTTGGSVIEELKAALRRVKINLPGSTTPATFLRDLLVATLQLPESSSDDLQPVPIYMSIGDNDMKLTQQQAETLVATKATNPATNKPFAMEDFGFTTATQTNTTELSTLKTALQEKDQELNGMKGLLGAFKAKFVSDTQAAIQQRISALVRTGVVTKEYAEANLIPKVEFQMSLVGGAIADHPLTMVLSTLEALPVAHKPTSRSTFDGVIEPNDALDDGVTLTDEQMDKAMKSLEADGFL